MADAVDDAGRIDRDPHHLHRPHRGADGTEQRHVDQQHHAHALPRIAGVEIALDPVVGHAVAVLLQRFLVLGLGAIQLRALQQHGLDAARLRAVRVFLGLALGMVLAVNGHPLARDHAGREPEPEPEEMRHQRVQIQRPVGLVAVQKNRHRGNRDVGHDQREQQHLPPACTEQTEGQAVHYRVENHRQAIH